MVGGTFLHDLRAGPMLQKPSLYTVTEDAVRTSVPENFNPLEAFHIVRSNSMPVYAFKRHNGSSVGPASSPSLSSNYCIGSPMLTA
jgi:hypothetical protein